MEQTYLSREDIKEFLNAFSGVNEYGENNSIVNYQTYDASEGSNDPNKEQIYSASKARVELSFDANNPDFYVMDLIYRGYDDPELKMLWARLQQFKRNTRLHPDKTWIFYFNLLERDCISVEADMKDTLHIANVFNPTLFYLTREEPDYLATDSIDMDGELQGGNVIRMLIPVQFITFEVTNEIDTTQIKEEILIEKEHDRYINNAAWED